MARRDQGGNNNSGGASKNGDRLSGAAIAMAVAVIVVYVVFVWLAWARVEEVDTLFNRRLNLLGGLEAIAFAAAGALFGTVVQRQVTKKAEKEAGEQKQRADGNEKDAEKGRALDALARTKAQQAGPRFRAAGQDPVDQMTTELQEFIDLADQYR